MQEKNHNSSHTLNTELKQTQNGNAVCEKKLGVL